MIAVLSLAVAILAVLFGPLVAWAIARQQIAVAARETWMREFRERVAAFLSAYDAFLSHIRSHTTGDPEKEKRLATISDAEILPYHNIRLLIAEKGPRYADIIQIMDNLLRATTDNVALHRQELFDAAEHILQCERAAIAEDPGVWSALLVSLRRRAGG